MGLALPEWNLTSLQAYNPSLAGLAQDLAPEEGSAEQPSPTQGEHSEEHMLDSLGLADDSLSSSTAGGSTSPAGSQQLKPGTLSPGPLGKGLVGLSGSTASSGSYPAGSLALPPLPRSVKTALLPSQLGVHGTDSQLAGPAQLGEGPAEDDVYRDAEDEIMTITSSEGTEQALAEAVAAMEEPDSEGASHHRLASSTDQMTADLQPHCLSAPTLSAALGGCLCLDHIWSGLPGRVACC